MKTIFFIVFHIILISFCYSQENLSSNYDLLIKSADSLSITQYYSEALKNYESAYSIKQTDELERKINFTKYMILSKEKFNKLVNTADSLFNKGNYVDAKELYLKSIMIMPKVYSIHDRVNEIDFILKEEENNHSNDLK